MLSRIAKIPLEIPEGVEVTVLGSLVTVKGKLGLLSYTFNNAVKIIKNNNLISFEALESTKFAKALSGTICALIRNMITGVTSGFEKKLLIVGVGYRAAIAGDVLTLSLGYSHPVVYHVPEGIKIEVPSQTEIVVKGMHKELVGQVAAVIRGFRSPEPYKGKGVRYADENIIKKEPKKK